MGKGSGRGESAKGFDEESPGKAGRVVQRADAHLRPGAKRDLAAHRVALGSDAARWSQDFALIGQGGADHGAWETNGVMEMRRVRD